LDNAALSVIDRHAHAIDRTQNANARRCFGWVVERFARGNLEAIVAEYFSNETFSNELLDKKFRALRATAPTHQNRRRENAVRARSRRSRDRRENRGNDSKTRTDRKPERSNFS
jgi:hypothetical protein